MGEIDPDAVIPLPKSASSTLIQYQTETRGRELGGLLGVRLATYDLRDFEEQWWTGQIAVTGTGVALASISIVPPTDPSVSVEIVYLTLDALTARFWQVLLRVRSVTGQLTLSIGQANNTAGVEVPFVSPSASDGIDTGNRFTNHVRPVKLYQNKLSPTAPNDVLTIQSVANLPAAEIATVRFIARKIPDQVITRNGDDMITGTP